MPRKPGAPYRAELAGKTFGQWVVLRRIHGSMWLCRCSCGTEKSVQGGTLTRGTSKSCGCKSKDWCRTHGMERTATYRVWAQMLSRCRNNRHKQYASYGGRGITVDERWARFENFHADMGDKPEGKSIDRIDNDGGYSKNNCRWVTHTEQMRNRRMTKFLSFQGVTLSVPEWAERLCIKRQVIQGRIKAGWSVVDTLTKPKSGRWGIINA